MAVGWAHSENEGPEVDGSYHFWIPVGGERSRGRPATRWEDELKEFATSIGKKWEDCAADRGLWGSLEASVVEFGVA